MTQLLCSPATPVLFGRASVPDLAVKLLAHLWAGEVEVDDGFGGLEARGGLLPQRQQRAAVAYPGVVLIAVLYLQDAILSCPAVAWREGHGPPAQSHHDGFAAAPKPWRNNPTYTSPIWAYPASQSLNAASWWSVMPAVIQ